MENECSDITTPAVFSYSLEPCNLRSHLGAGGTVSRSLRIAPTIHWLDLQCFLVCIAKKFIKMHIFQCGCIYSFLQKVEYDFKVIYVHILDKNILIDNKCYQNIKIIYFLLLFSKG